MKDYRWTVRLGDNGNCIEMLREVAEFSGLKYGDLLEMALADWYEGLPVENMSSETLPTSDSRTSQQAL